ncbi:uncharacterized protein CIMG_03591 [Coccidioides immitis RS]|uniref:Uncharacterized protein n=1 Tax=Coccidioides immitis (strain RS) TaxID=246410 RepID=J3KBQ0_COCIM|nr:uncharacterized protein CIMG_03591 [Coccidioides immitis RS]EAS32567.3 hypothetical protein CIMG_03591 [Coccidioides immitis RS]
MEYRLYCGYLLGDSHATFRSEIYRRALQSSCEARNPGNPPKADYDAPWGVFLPSKLIAKHFLGGEGIKMLNTLQLATLLKTGPILIGILFILRASARAAQSRKPEDTKGLGAEKPTDRPAVTSTPYRVVKKTSHNSHRRKAKEVADTKCGFWILEEQRFVNTTLRGDNKTLKHGLPG